MAKEKAPEVLADSSGAQVQDDDSKNRRQRQVEAMDAAEDRIPEEGGEIGDWAQSEGLELGDVTAKLAELKQYEQGNREAALQEKFKAWGRRAAWTGILYPEMKAVVEKAAGRPWEDIAEGLHVPMLRSPFHQDLMLKLDEVTMAPKLVKKKGHWHVLFYSPGGKFSYSQMKAILGDELGCVMIEPALSIGALTRYFFHLDCEPVEVSGKHKYPIVDGLVLSGFEIAPYLYWRTEDQTGATKQVIQFAKDNGIYQYSELVDAINTADRDDWNYMMTIPNFRMGIRDYMTNRWHVYARGAKPYDVAKAQQAEIDRLAGQMQAMTDLIRDQFGIDLTKGSGDDE